MRKEPVPFPRIRGKAFQDDRGHWTWFMEILIGDCAESLQLSPEGDKHFLNRDAAIFDMKARIPDLVEGIGKVFGVKFEGYQDLIKNQFVESVKDL